MEKKELEIGSDYGYIFGLASGKGQKMVYLGNNVWKAEKPGMVKEMESVPTTAKAIEYINRPSIHMGM